MWNILLIRNCNCDSGEDGIDEGLNEYKNLLPILDLFIGGTTESSSANITIGPLICSGRSTFQSCKKRILKARKYFIFLFLDVFEGVVLTDRNERLIGSHQCAHYDSFFGTIGRDGLHSRRVFDVYMQLRFALPQMTVFTSLSKNQQRFYQLQIRGKQIKNMILTLGTYTKSIFFRRKGSRKNILRWHQSWNYCGCPDQW